jgi:WD40 repeat protein
MLKTINTPSAKKAVKKINHLMAARHDFYRHIPLAEHYIARPDNIETIQADLLQPESFILALHGMGGIGKTVLLRALCDEPRIQTRFADGILWMSFGSEVHEAQLEQKLKEWIKALNGTTHDTESNLNSLKNRLAELLKNQACLLILDDVWTKEQIETFRVAGNKCRIIVSTRDAEIAHEMGATILPVDVMSDSLALELLEKWSQGSLENIPMRYKELIVESLGALPLALKLAGGQLRTKQAAEWLKTFNVRKLKSKRPDENNIHDSFERTFTLSLDALGVVERRLYTSLVIIPQAAISEQVIFRLWDALGQSDAETSKELVTDLASRALCDMTVDNASGTRSIAVHGLLRSFLYSDLDVADRQGVHLAMLSAYERLQTGDGWHTVPDDGYFYHYFPFHLKEAGKNDLLRQLLLDYDFIQATLVATPDIGYLIGDYYILRDPNLQLVQYAIQQSESILRDAPEQLAECLYTQLMIFRDQSPDIDALLDACYKVNSPKLFPIQSPFRARGVAFQYYPDYQEVAIWQGGEELTEEDKANLGTNFAFLQSEEVKAQLLNHNQDRVAESPPDPRPFSYPNGFHMSSNWNIPHSWGSFGIIQDFAISGDFAFGASGNDVMVWDWYTGKLFRQLYGHTDTINQIAVSGEFVITASNDGTIKVWDWHTGNEIKVTSGLTGNRIEVDWQEGTLVRTLKGLTGKLTRLALSGEFVATASDKFVKIWNWHTGEHFCTFTESEDGSLDVSLFEDDVAMVTPNNIVQVWNWQTDNALYSHESPEDSILSTFLKGEFVFYVLENQTLKIWNWRTMKSVATIREFSGQVLDVVAQNKLLTALDNELYLWDLRTGELIISFYAGDFYVPYADDSRDDPIQNAIVTPNFERFIVGTQEGQILFLQPNPALLAILRGSS